MTIRYLRWSLASFCIVLALYASMMIYYADQQAKELRFFVRVKFDLPPSHTLFIDGEPHQNTVYMNTKHQYTISYRVDNTITREFLFRPEAIK